MNKKIIDYKIITAKTLSELRNNIKEYILEGWQPFAGISIRDLDFVQIIVKYEE